MKTIVIAGGGRNVGKTTLAQALAQLLPKSVVVKLGHHPAKPGRPSNYFPIGTPLRKIVPQLPDGEFLILESGSVLDDPDLAADLVIFLPSRDPKAAGDPKAAEGPKAAEDPKAAEGPKAADKPGSARRRNRADIIRGETLDESRAIELAHRLGVGSDLFRQILEIVQS